MFRFFMVAVLISLTSWGISAQTTPAIEQAVPEEVAAAPAGTTAPETHKLNSPAKKVVLYMLDEFKKMSASRQRYLDGKQSHADYMKKDKSMAEEVSTTIDFYDVVEKSLKYDYDAKNKKFRKDHWAGKKPEDRKYFVSLFRQLIEEIVYPIANEFFGDLEMRHEVLEVKSDYVHVKTMVRNVKKKKKRNDEFIVDWYLHPKAEGGWIIYDIGVEGERWVPGFRSQFNDVITQKSYKELVNMMKKKLKETKEDRLDKDKKDRIKAKNKTTEKKEN